MDILLQNIQQTQLPLIKELAKALGITYKETDVDAENKQKIQEAIARVETGTAALKDLDWDEFRSLAYGK